MWDLESFNYLIQHQIVLKLLECHPGVVDCQSEVKLFCRNREFTFQSYPKSQTEEVEYEIWGAFIMELNIRLSWNYVECHPGVVDCQSESKLFCGSREFYFLKPFKIKGRSGRMWDLESFYYLIQHQIVLKQLECHPGVVDCQSELKLFCGNRDFYF